MTNRTLKTADPTIVPKPTWDFIDVPIKDVASSGADPPAAIRVAPATSGVIPGYFSQILSRAGTKNSSQIIAIAIAVYTIPMTYKNMGYTSRCISSLSHVLGYIKTVPVVVAAVTFVLFAKTMVSFFIGKHCGSQSQVFASQNENDIVNNFNFNFPTDN